MPSPAPAPRGLPDCYPRPRLTAPELVIENVNDIRDSAELTKAIKTVVASKQHVNEDIIAPLVAEAVLAVLPKNPLNYNVDNIRVVKIMGSSLTESRVVRGMVFPRSPDGSVKSATKAKVGAGEGTDRPES